MPDRKKSNRKGKARVKTGATRTPEDVFAFWDEQSMREAKPISIDVDRPRRDDDPSEEK